MKKQTVFFDRDGIVNVRIIDDYIKKIEEFELIPEFVDIFRYVKEQGYLVVLITNQQGIGKGVMNEKDLDKVHAYMQDELEKQTNFRFDDLYHCADLAGTGSKHRKPQPGMLLDAIAKWNVDVPNSWMIGDSIKDAQAGKAAELHTILIGEYEGIAEADYIYTDLKLAQNMLESR